jgi:S1-C subfamily serine protease
VIERTLNGCACWIETACGIICGRRARGKSVGDARGGTAHELGLAGTEPRGGADAVARADGQAGLARGRQHQDFAAPSKKAGRRNPLLDDPFFRRFFDVPPESQPHERQFQSAGSGVIVDAKNGYIITNYHVIENASEITITLLDNREFKAKVLGSDEGSDLALLQAQAAESRRAGAG